MTLAQLRYFVALAEHGHFGRAAEAAGVSQPTLSAQLRKLEGFLGAPLFERGGGAALTPLGEKVLERARRILSETDAILGVAQHRVAPLVGPRRLGVIPTLCPYLLPWALPALRNAHERLELICLEEITERLIDRLRRREIDWAIAAAPIDDPGLEAHPLFDEPFYAALPEKHPLAKKAKTTQAALAEEKVLLLAEGHCLRDQTLTLCGTGAPNREDTRATSLETLRGLVAAGQGTTLMPALATRENDGTAIKPLSPPAARRIVLVARRGAEARGEARAVSETLRKAAPKSVDVECLST
ncbi:MAG: LysR substrate-binding domain-containing protein [Pseudomonadota bacterium]